MKGRLERELARGLCLGQGYVMGYWREGGECLVGWGGVGGGGRRERIMGRPGESGSTGRATINSDRSWEGLWAWHGAVSGVGPQSLGDSRGGGKVSL